MSGRREIDGSSAEPVGDGEFERLFAGLERFDAWLIAVSGGADSVALLHLIARWLRRGAAAPSRVVVATVDHGLRPGSAEEARFVASAAATEGLAHRTLTWTGEKPRTGIQSAARAARYALLAAAAAELGGKRAAVLTAHTEDDEAETFLMRLARGSGLDGLAGMSRERGLASGITLVRPLIGVSKSRLVATLREAGIAWVEDPSNDDTAFERVRMRRATPLLSGLGLEAPSIARSARRLLRARRALEAGADALFDAAVDLTQGLFAVIDRAALSAAPEELGIRVLGRCLAAFGGRAPRARLAEIEGLGDAIGAGRTFGATLGGCVVSAGARRVRIYREPGRRPFEEVPLSPGVPARWDDRFEVLVRDTPEIRDAMRDEKFVVRALGTSAHATLKALRASRACPLRAAIGLPAVWSGDDLLGLPAIASATDFVGHADCRAEKKAASEALRHACAARFIGLETSLGGGRPGVERE